MAKVINLRKENGQVTLDTDLAYVFSLLANGRYTLTIKRATQKRSLPQNDLMWLWLTCIERETGTPKEDVYMYYCKKFLMKTISVGGKEERIYNTSSKLSSEQMTDFLNKIQADAASELGITLPNPEDRFFEQFYAQFNN